MTLAEDRAESEHVGPRIDEAGFPLRCSGGM